MSDVPPDLDMRVRLIFDEDFNTLSFPIVKEITLKLSSDSPFELAAKALALKNRHPELWRRYTFSIMVKDYEAQEEGAASTMMKDE